MTDVATFRSAILCEIDGAIFFRKQKSEQYPDDDRNQRCAENLAVLHQGIAELREDDPAFLKCFEAYRDKHQAAGNLENTAWLENDLWFPRDDDSGYGVSKPIFSRYGFDCPKNGDAREFLASLSEEIEGWEAADLRLDELV